MSDNHLKTPLNYSLGRWMGDRQTRALQVPGRSLPCTVAKVVSSGLVMVNFEVTTGGQPLPQVTVPVEYPEYIRYPIQVGDKGVVFGSDVYLGQITGTGPMTVPDLTQPLNLGALSFVWLGNTNWTSAIDPKAVEIYGVGNSGVILHDGNSGTTLTLTNTGITIDLGGDITINSNGYNVNVLGGGDVITGSGTVSLLNHTHSGVTTGGGDTGPPVT